MGFMRAVSVHHCVCAASWHMNVCAYLHRTPCDGLEVADCAIPKHWGPIVAVTVTLDHRASHYWFSKPVRASVTAPLQTGPDKREAGSDAGNIGRSY